jgi:hypothetical protein
VSTRIEREKDILQALDDENYKLNTDMDREKTDRTLTLGQFKDNTKDDQKKQSKHIAEF